MFKVPGKRNAETWKHFLTEEIKNAEGNVIPPPMSGMEQFIATLQAAGTELYDAARGNSGTEGYLIIAMVLILVLVTGGMVALCFLPGSSPKCCFVVSVCPTFQNLFYSMQHT